MGDVKLLPCPICGNTAVEPRRFDGEWSLVCADNRHMCEVTGMDRSDVIAAWNNRPALTPAQQAAEEMVEAAQALADSMETCHECNGTVFVQEQPVHCEDCSGDCDIHEGSECATISSLHLALKRKLAALAKAGKP